MGEAHRKPSLRLLGHDYATTGSYFVTICVEGKRLLFGSIAESATVLAEAGLMVESWWGNIERRFPTVMIGAYVVMPNHFHGIVHLGAVAETNSTTHGAGGHGGPPLRTPPIPTETAPCYDNIVGVARRGHPATEHDTSSSEPPSLSNVIGWLKSATTHDYGIGVQNFGCPPYDRRLWQRGFYDHIVRNASDLARIERYIEDNPARWAIDELFAD